MDKYKTDASRADRDSDGKDGTLSGTLTNQQLRDKILRAMVSISIMELEREGLLSHRKLRRLRRQHAQRRLASERQ